MFKFFSAINLLFLLALALVACSGSSDGDEDGGAGAFSIDPYPAQVNQTPVELTGTKTAGLGILLDGAEAVAASESLSWSLSLVLAEGANSFQLTAVDGQGQGQGSEQVDMLLDSVAPRVISYAPDADATGVPVNAAVEVTFSEAMNCATITGAVFAIQGVTASLNCVAGNPVVGLVPAGDLAADTSYTVTLFSDAADPAGNTLDADVVWQFTTGQGVDDVPPVAPTADNPAPSSPTFSAQMDVGGAKEAGASVEFRHELDGVQQQSWTEIAGKSAEVVWSYTFQLGLGQNAFQLRSIDLAGNVSTTTTDFNVQRDPDPNQVDPPTVNQVVSPTGTANQLLRGTKPADTSVRNGGQVLYPRTAGTNWDALVSLTPGNNHLDLTAQDGSGNASDPLGVDIVYNPPGQVPAGSQLQIEFDLRDLWDYIGDEMYYRDVAHGVEINHYGVDIWVEGPFTPGEPCMWNAGRKQRKYTRYVGAISRGVQEPGCTLNPGDVPCSGWWNLSNYLGTNFLAALIESGQWENSSWPIPRDVIRRDPSTGEQWPAGIGGGNQPAHPEIHYPWQTPWGEWVTRTRMSQTPFVDGVTEATIDPDQNPAGGAALGTWVGQKTYTWDLSDHAGNPIQQGTYLVNILFTLDRARDLTLHYSAMRAQDQETCWDDPAHDDEGMHRAEGLMVIGDSDATLYLYEKAVLETVDACKWTDDHFTNLIKCNCAVGDAWPCPAEPSSNQALMGARILYMDPDKFVDPNGDGQNYAVRLRYCAGSACP